MKILFVITGVGLGDATREEANIKAFLKRKPSTKILVCGYGNSYDYFKNKFPTIKIHGYQIPGKSLRFRVIPFLLKNYLLPLFWFFETLKLKRKVRGFNPDVIISDFEPIGVTLAKLLHKKCVVIFGYDPAQFEAYTKTHNVSKKILLESKFFEKIYNQANMVIIPTLLGGEKKSLLYNYIHPIIRVSPEKMPSEKILIKKLGLKKKPIIVMLGGSNFGIKLAQHIEQVAKKFPDEQFLIFGSQTTIKTSAPNVAHKKFVPNFLEYLKVCNGVVTLAGQKTLTESIVFKKPMLVFPIEEHIEQLMNAYSVKDVAVVSKYVDEIYLEKVLKYFLEKRGTMAAKLMELKVEADGSEQVVDLVYNILK
ncbi:hypothetical protein HY643_01835 [Candidatus Woesearchaeota archaeon]|nr:hypothetical protein [Candidatus Woesearchaeota archaeon]